MAKRTKAAPRHEKAVSTKPWQVSGVSDQRQKKLVEQTPHAKARRWLQLSLGFIIADPELTREEHLRLKSAMEKRGQEMNQVEDDTGQLDNSGIVYAFLEAIGREGIERILSTPRDEPPAD